MRAADTSAGGISGRASHPLALLTDRVATRRGAAICLILWLLAAVAANVAAVAFPAPSRTGSDLPASAESVRADAALQRIFPGPRGAPALVVYARRDGLTAADRARARAFASWLRSPAAPRNIVAVVDPFAGEPAAAGLVSRDRSALIVGATVIGDDPSAAVDALRTRAGEGGGGLRIRLTGPAGITTDATEIFGGADGRLLLATVALVLFLLGAVYRAPLLALTPLLAVGWAYSVAQGLLTVGEHVAGLAISGQTGSSVTVLLFGAGTDYTLFIVSRYRAELIRRDNPSNAMRIALRAVAEAILASGGVVLLAMIALSFASYGTYHQFGVALAVSVAVVLLAGLTLIPAALVLLGRAAFWPAVPRVGHPEASRVPLWGRVGDFVARRPAVAVVAPLIVLAALASNVVGYRERFDFLQSFLKPTPSAQGYDLLRTAFGPGTLAPAQVVILSSGKTASRDARAVARALVAMPAVASVNLGGATGDGHAAQLQLTLTGNPYAPETIAHIPDLRLRARDALPTGRVLIGGETATSYDAKVISDRDTRTVGATVLVLIAIVLGLLLRSALAPIYLLLINGLGYLAAFGLLLLVNRTILGSDTVSYELPLNLFVFLTALGADYNIFLLSRVREEAREQPLREAVRRAVSRTGGVISSAGVILAGTFAVLAVLPIRETVELGVGVALGVLLDTFVVRALLVPGITVLLGRYAWWPAHLEAASIPPAAPSPGTATPRGHATGGPTPARATD